MRRTIVAFLSAGLLVLAAQAPASAIVWGSPDGNGHPYVGLISFYDSEGAYVWRCTGTLLTSRVVLTAGHCTYGASTARAYFTPDVNAADYRGNTGGTTGVPIPDPDYWPGVWPGPLEDWAYIEDVGVVLLDSPVSSAEFGELAEIGTIDDLAAQTKPPATFTLVGYGWQDAAPVIVAMPTRYRATVWLRSQRSALTRDYYIQVSSTAKSGGLCFGDSGGPVFLPGTSTIVAVNSYVMNGNCAGNGWSYRVDTERSQAFIDPYLP